LQATELDVQQQNLLLFLWKKADTRDDIALVQQHKSPNFLPSCKALKEASISFGL